VKGDKVVIDTLGGKTLTIQTTVAGRRLVTSTRMRAKGQWYEIVEVTRNARPTGYAVRVPMAVVQGITEQLTGESEAKRRRAKSKPELAAPEVTG
jgi:hypothetical protein